MNTSARYMLDEFTCAISLRALSDAVESSDLEGARSIACESALRFSNLAHGIEIAWLPSVERAVDRGLDEADGLRAEHRHIFRLLDEVRDAAARGDQQGAMESLHRAQLVLESHLRRERSTSAAVRERMPEPRRVAAETVLRRVRAALDEQVRLRESLP